MRLGLFADLAAFYLPLPLFARFHEVFAVNLIDLG
jgi:hypothetical protein